MSTKPAIYFQRINKINKHRDMHTFGLVITFIFHHNIYKKYLWLKMLFPRKRLKGSVLRHWCFPCHPPEKISSIHRRYRDWWSCLSSIVQGKLIIPGVSVIVVLHFSVKLMPVSLMNGLLGLNSRTPNPREKLLEEKSLWWKSDAVLGHENSSLIMFPKFRH